ncbi:hypothetical protein QL285_000241 [Trifolium repens]|nr:hypothetical protein QL285_000241 [Trifolium repens]
MDSSYGPFDLIKWIGFKLKTNRSGPRDQSHAHDLNWEGANDVLPRHRLQPPTCNKEKRSNHGCKDAPRVATPFPRFGLKKYVLIYYVARFFALIMNMPLFFLNNAHMKKNDGNKVR